VATGESPAQLTKENEMSDIVERLYEESQDNVDDDRWIAAQEIESLRQQLAESQANEKRQLKLLDDAEAVIVAQRKERLESQAREKVLRDALEQWDRLIDYQFTGSSEAMTALQQAADTGADALAQPQDYTALDSAIKQAKREALLEAADWLTEEHGRTHEPIELRKIVEELK
jgi:hypothetical protein